jgi:uncharacterized protein (DUF427 family)
MSSSESVEKPMKESVWDYPRPPRLEPTAQHLRIELAGEVVADTRTAFRVLETSHPPVYYIPPGDVAQGLLQPAQGGSFCEWKGRARYWDLVVGERVVPGAGWSYPDPTPAFAPIRDHVAFYPAPMGGCFVDGERVTPQPGHFYGGWITSNLDGPFKGEPGTRGW